MVSPDRALMQTAARVVASEPLTSTQGMPAKTAAWHGKQLPWQPLLSMTSACGCASMENELKEHGTFECVQLFNPDLESKVRSTSAHLAFTEPVDGMDECASAVFLQTRRKSGCSQVTTL